MERINITRSDLAKLPILKTSTTPGESIIYVNGDTLYKIICDIDMYDSIPIKEKRKKHFENVKYITDLDVPEYQKPKRLIYIKNEFVGFELDYLKNYKTLKEELKSDISLSDRIIICKKIIDIFKRLLSSGIIFFDININQIMIKDLDIMIIDTTTFLKVRDLTKKQLDIETRIFSFKLMMVVLSFIYGLNLEKIYYHLTLKKFYRLLKYLTQGTSLSEKIKEAFFGTSAYYDIDAELDSIDESIYTLVHSLKKN